MFKKLSSVEIPQFGKFAVGLPIKIIGGIHYKKTGIISKIVDHDPNCWSNCPIDLMIDLFVKLDENEGEHIIIPENLKLN